MGKSKSKSRQAMLLGCFSIAFLSLIIILFSIYSMNKISMESDFIVQNILPTRTVSIKMLTSVINQQTGIRAYIISEDKAFLESYYAENKEIQGYYSSLDDLLETGVGINTVNELKQQMKSVEIHFQEQTILVNNGKAGEAKLNLNKGENLVDEFRATDNMLLDEIELNISSSRNKVATTQTIHTYLLVFLSVILVVCNFIFISYVWKSLHEEIKKKNEINEDLQKVITSQEEYIANISHELKTPLNVILSASQLLDLYCENGLLDEKKNSTVKCIDSIKLNTYRLSKLINNIIDLSKIEFGIFELNLSNNNIVEVVEEMVMAVTEFSQSKGLSIIFDTDIEEKIIACDPEKMDKIVLNLISNAIKFSKEDKGEIFVNIKDKIGFVEISVEDNGIGIEKRHLNVIFDKYSQIDKSLSRNAEGTGVGLSLVKSIVELAGGSISVESELGVGSKFTIKLPSEKVVNESMQFNNAVRDENKIIQVEFSDVY